MTFHQDRNTACFLGLEYVYWRIVYDGVTNIACDQKRCLPGRRKRQKMKMPIHEHTIRLHTIRRTCILSVLQAVYPLHGLQVSVSRNVSADKTT